MLAVMGSDFVRTARASGLTPKTVILTYAFRNAMLPVVTTLGMVFSFTLFILLLVCALFGPYLVPYDPLATNTVVALKPPSLHHLMGTDQLGRDLLSRVVVATRLDMEVAIFSVALVFVLGGISGI